MHSSSLAWVVIVLYGLFYLAAVAWCLWAGRPVPFWGVPGADRVFSALPAGVAAALVVVGTSRLLFRYVGAVRHIAERFRTMLGPLGEREIFVVAATSSLGEEALFRGAAQPAWGIVGASVVFGLLHAPVERWMWPWTLWAVAMGFMLGALASWEGGLVSPVAAHFGINWLNLRHICGLPEVVPERDGEPGGDDAVQG